jgi:Ca2+-transporting ATPase
MLLLLQAAAVLSAFLRDWPSTAIIVLVVLFNTTLGVLQQRRADHVMAELALLSAPSAHVRRDDRVVRVPADTLVPGDHVLLAGGDLVPADAVVLEGHSLDVDEAPVTGESLAVRREDCDELVSGTRVISGRAVARVTRTGADSSLGRIAALLLDAEARQTPLQRRLARVSRGLVVLVVALTAVVVALGVLQGRPWGDMVLVGLSLTVAAVPESLPAVVTIALAVGAHRMARRHVVVRSLPAVETLGSVTVVATDKTGTITEGRMEAMAVWAEGERTDAGAIEGRGRPGVAELLRDVALCNDASTGEGTGGPGAVSGAMERALLVLAARSGVDVAAVREEWPRTGERPFDTATRAMTTEHRSADGRTLHVCKGAPEAVLPLLGDGVAGPVGPRAAAEELAAEGLRVIAVADSADGAAWRFAGLVGIGDPPRAAARDVVRRLDRAGIRVVLVTGDHPGTAAAIARQVGISRPGDQPVEGGDLADLSAGRRSGLTVVARVLPAQKVHVVQWLQDAGEVVAMLGDGVNDAPALRRADIGVAAGLRGSEVAKEAADLVLTDDDLGSVVAAVEEGRRIFANIRAFLLFGVSGGLAEVWVMLAGGAVGLPVPLLPAQILWINLLTHGLVGIAFGSQPLDPAEMATPPRPPSESMFTRDALVRLALLSGALTAVVLVVAGVAGGSQDERRTAVFLTLGAAQLGVALALRSPGGALRSGERGVDLAVLAAAALLAIAVWLPAAQELLGTRTVPPATVVLALAASLVPGVLLRLARRNRERWSGDVGGVD